MTDPGSASSSKPPKILYHYTSQAGLLGILREKTIWATNIRYLSDAKEFAYTIELALAMLGKVKGDIESDLSRLIRSLPESSDITAGFVVSFSSQNDLLSQWRGYCPRNGGFTIGFDSERLMKLAEEQDFALSRCIYESEEQDGLIRKCIQLAASSMNGAGVSQKETSGFDMDSYLKKVGEAELDFVLGMLLLGPRIKHPSFSQEDEWRLVSNPPAVKEKKIKFREGMSMIVPYIEFHLSTQIESMPIKEITIGPTPHNELSMISIRRLLQANGIRHCSVRCSEIPYRTW